MKGDAAQFSGSARASRALSGTSPKRSQGISYSERRLPHFERPWAKYAVAFCTYERRPLVNEERDIVLRSISYGHERLHYEVYVACVMPDHVHLLFEPQIKHEGSAGDPIFWSLSDILHGIKSSTAHRINKLRSPTHKSSNLTTTRMPVNGRRAPKDTGSIRPRNMEIKSLHRRAHAPDDFARPEGFA